MKCSTILPVLRSQRKLEALALCASIVGKPFLISDFAAKMKVAVSIASDVLKALRADGFIDYEATLTKRASYDYIVTRVSKAFVNPKDDLQLRLF